MKKKFQAPNPKKIFLILLSTARRISDLPNKTSPGLKMGGDIKKVSSSEMLSRIWAFSQYK